MITITKILKYLDANNEKYYFYGNENDKIAGFSSLSQYKSGTLTWFSGRIDDNFGKNIQLAIVQSGFQCTAKNRIIVDNSKRIFFNILSKFFETNSILPDIGSGSYIGENVKIGKNVKIGYNCVIDGDITIGDNTEIFHNVVIINSVKIGKNCIIHSGASIGHNGFGYYTDKNGINTMIDHYGKVTIEDNVFIGSNTIIHRGTIDDTVVKCNTKIDTLCHIAHNTQIGNNNTLLPMCAVFGSTVTGDNCYLGSTKITDNIKLGSNVRTGIDSTVLKDIEDDVVAVGTPAVIIRKHNENI